MERNTSFLAYLSGVFTSIFGSITQQDIAFYVGITTALGTFAVNWWYKHKEAKRRESKGT